MLRVPFSESREWDLLHVGDMRRTPSVATKPHFVIQVYCTAGVLEGFQRYAGSPKSSTLNLQKANQNKYPFGLP